MAPTPSALQTNNGNMPSLLRRDTRSALTEERICKGYSMKISVVTVSYNSEKTIAQTIESVLAQTCPAFEYLIIDGASTDATVQVAERYRSAFAEKGVRYVVISEKDAGIYNAMNKGVAMARGDIVGIINSDDWYEPTALAYVNRAYEEAPFDVFFADLRIVKEGGSFVKKAKLSGITSTRHWNHPTMFVARRVYDAYHYDCGSGSAADFDLYLRLKKVGVTIRIGHEVLANFRFGGVSNDRNLKKIWRRIMSKYRMYRRHGYSPFYFLDCVAIEAAKFLWAA